MRRWSIALLWLAVLALQAAPARAAAEWTRLRSGHFTVEGNVSGDDLRVVARRLEQFREAIGRLLPGARLVTPTPLTVVVFAYNRDLKSVSPLFRGKPIDVGGYALVSPFGTSIAMSLEAGDAAYPTVFHEFAHLLIANAVPALPLWASEGLAEYYKTFWVSADARRVIVGQPLSTAQLELLRGRSLLPLSQLLAVDGGSAIYNDGPDRSRFYVECWALVHYLLLGDQARAGQFTKFVSRVAAGAPPATAFSETISNAGALESELSDYAHRLTFSAVQYTFPDRVASEQRDVEERMSTAQAEASLGHLLVGQKRYKEAQARFTAALKLDPNCGSAHTGKGMILSVQGQSLEALQSLRKGAEFSPGDATAFFALGRASIGCVRPECEEQQGGSEPARKALLRAVEILPEFPDALSLLGFAELAAGASLDDAERHARAAITLLPGREDYRFNLALIYIRRGDLSNAQAVLGPIAAASPNADNKRRVRDLLGQVADRRIAAATARAVNSLGAAPPPPTSSDGTAAAGRPATGAGEIIPVYRKTLEGERRMDGVLVSIECPRPGIVLVLRDAAGSHHFAASSFDKVQFITYRDDLKGSIACGPQAAGLQVYLTYRQPGAGEAPLAAGLDGAAVAVEVLPKEK